MYGQLKSKNSYLLTTAIFLAVFLLSGCDNNQTVLGEVKDKSQQQQEQKEEIKEPEEKIKEPVIEIKEETKTFPVNFETINQNDSSLEKGQTKIKQEGKNGTKELKYKVAYKDGKEELRELISESITIQPINKIILIGTKSKPVSLYSCNCSKTCPQMSSCKEAQYQLNTCGCHARDADNDGIACDVDCQ